MLVDIGFFVGRAIEKSGTLWHEDAYEAEAAFVRSLQVCGFPAAGGDPRG